jgi:anti-sigma-K factor RskA
MRLARHPQLDALCGEYLLGTLRGRARRRFERALREEPLVAQRVELLMRAYVPKASEHQAVAPRADGWQRLRRELNLAPDARPWHRRVFASIAPWQWASAAAAAVALGIALTVLRPTEEFTAVARLAGDNAPVVTAALSSERRILRLSPTQSTPAPAGRSYELWLLPAEGGPPVSLGVLAALDARVTLAAAQASRLRAGAKLAVSVEPAGGSPTGAPTGPVILVGEIG